jgi:hypothetical protein
MKTKNQVENHSDQYEQRPGNAWEPSKAKANQTHQNQAKPISAQFPAEIQRKALTARAFSECGSQSKAVRHFANRSNQAMTRNERNQRSRIPLT